MRGFLTIAFLVLFITFSAFPQQVEPTPTPSPVNPVPSPTPVSVDSSKPNGYVLPDPKTRFKRYVNSMFGPVAIGRQVANAGFATWRNSPEEWGDKWEGFGRRVASNFGKNIIKRTVIYGLDEALKVDSHYYRSKKKDFGSKFRNALISPVTARNGEGKRIIGIPRIVGTYTSSIVAAETWYPGRYDWKDGLKNGTVSFAMNAGFNLFREFVWKK